MKGRFVRQLGVAGIVVMAAAFAGTIGAADATTGKKVMPPLSSPVLRRLLQHPSEMQRLLGRLPPAVPPGTSPTRSPSASHPAGGTWQALNHPLNLVVANPLLLTDGTVIVHDATAADWWRLTPDSNGSYVNGTWSQIASLPSGYAPTWFASQVLPDGRVIINGGEYNFGSAVWTNLGAIYDPIANAWTSVSPPVNWTTIGDAQSTLLANGTYMLANCCQTANGGGLQALWNGGSSWTSTGSGKFDENDEEGWTLLPDGNVLTVDAYVDTGTCGTHSEIYNSATGAWSSAGSTIQQLPDCNSSFPSYEMGPQVLRPDGTVVAFGGTTTGTAHTAIFNASNGSWSAGPNLPILSSVPYTLADAPAALEPSGTILFAASPGNWTSSEEFPTPAHFFEFGPTNAITQVADTADAGSVSSYCVNFLVLPTGQILATDACAADIEIYTPTGTYNSSWAPVVSSVPTSLSAGSSYQLTGVQLNGLSQGAAYGDDAQASTNYPLIRITNNSTGHVFYARTFSHSNSSIAPDQSSATMFTVPSNIEAGSGALVVVANGIPSQPVAVTIGNSTSYTLAVSKLGPGTVTSSPTGIDCGSTCQANFTIGTQVSLFQAPASGWSFLEWDGACAGIGGCVVTMDANENVLATFWTDGGSGPARAATTPGE